MVLKRANFARWIAMAMLFLVLHAIAGGLGYADEEEKRRVEISLSIFPRIVAVDNHFRSKLDGNDKVQLFFLYESNEDRAKELVDRLKLDNRSIGGKSVTAVTLSVSSVVQDLNKQIPTAIFLSERLSDNELIKVMKYAEEKNRLVFSPFSGDVERGVTVGISVTSRVKPYFNLPVLHRSNVAINALLMKMSKRYE